MLTLYGPLLLSACSSPPQQATPPSPTPSPAAEPAPAPAPAPVPADPLGPVPLPEVLAGFLKQRFGKPAQQAWHTDFTGDGQLDWLVSTGDSLLLFPDTGGVPDSWTATFLFGSEELTLRAPAPPPPELQGHRSPAATFLATEGTAAELLFWDTESGQLAWSQPIPDALAKAATEAMARFPAAFTAGTAGAKPAFAWNKNNVLSGESTFLCAKGPLGLVGDFDGDGASELVVLEEAPASDVLAHRWTAGGVEDKTLEYAICRVGVVPRPKHPLPVLDGEPIQPKGELLSLLIPEKSGVLAVYEGGDWVLRWISD